jgi:hypothetical protein
MLSSYNINKTLLIHTDDEYITKDAVLSIPRGETSFYIVLDAHTRLILILADVIKHVYPTKELDQSVQRSTETSYTISYDKIRVIERYLADWLDKLPMSLRPGEEGTPEVLR